VTKVTIVGGGLAGMFAAVSLAEAGCEVTLFEGSHRLGGKAGSNFTNGHYQDHGYHVFPAWYLNIWALMRKLKADKNFIPITDFHEIEKGKFPHFDSFHNVASHNLRTFWENLTSNALPVPDMFLFYFMALDLICQSDNPPGKLDEMSVAGFTQTHRYHSELATREIHEMLLKACSSPSYTLSSLTLQKMLQYWVRYPEPMYSITKESLQESFIMPIEARMRELGCDIRLNHRLDCIETVGHRVTALELMQTDSNTVIRHDVDQLIVALQPKDFWKVLKADSQLFQIAPKLYDLYYLDAEPMAALHIPLKTRPANMKPDHVGLVGSEFELSFVDVSQYREGYDQPVLNVVASDFTRLKEMQEDTATRIIISELQSYFPTGFEEENIDWDNVCFQAHSEEPLFMNNVGSWAYRPDPNQAVEGLPNLFLAGDYCKTDINLATMEGAAESGLRAAKALAQAIKLPNVTELETLKFYPRWFCRLLKIPATLIAEIMLQWSWWIHRKDTQNG
jgi:uncharacterized protein with NAD-binding domain and iron-sulfur cluster